LVDGGDGFRLHLLGELGEFGIVEELEVGFFGRGIDDEMDGLVVRCFKGVEARQLGVGEFDEAVVVSGDGFEFMPPSVGVGDYGGPVGVVRRENCCKLPAHGDVSRGVNC